MMEGQGKSSIAPTFPKRGYNYWEDLKVVSNTDLWSLNRMWSLGQV